MKPFTMRTLIALTIAGSLSSVAWAGTNGGVWAAKSGNGTQCDAATLRGSYIFAASGFNIVGGVAQPKAIVELIDFHGDGSLTVTGGTLSVNGVVSQIAPNGVGNYTLDPDCNGTLAFIPGPSFHLFVERDGKSGVMIQTGPPAVPSVFQGTLTLRK